MNVIKKVSLYFISQRCVLIRATQGSGLQKSTNGIIGQLRRRYSTNTSGSSGSGKKTTWRNISGEWKIIGTAGIAISSWYLNAKQDRIHIRGKLQMELVTRQIKELYGPLYGNRIVAETSYRSVMKQHGGLKKYLGQARTTKDAEMIKIWRSYVFHVLYPLDKEAMKMIISSAHLIADTEFPEEFDRFLTHAAQMQFIMENWKNEKGNLKTTKEFTDDDFLEETNSSGIGGSRSIINHLRERCRMLRRRQQTSMDEINIDNMTLGVLSKVVK